MILLDFLVIDGKNIEAFFYQALHLFRTYTYTSFTYFPKIVFILRNINKTRLLSLEGRNAKAEGYR